MRNFDKERQAELSEIFTRLKQLKSRYRNKYDIFPPVVTFSSPFIVQTILSRIER